MSSEGHPANAPANEEVATRLLESARAGEETETAQLAGVLAEQILQNPLVLLAQQVLAGGPFAMVRALELAEAVVGIPFDFETVALAEAETTGAG